ncbi:hypothetical protein Q8A73_004229 [Channa argus]|nr:hypothetical protein Q8A73_004229 [Channa argus]
MKVVMRMSNRRNVMMKTVKTKKRRIIVVDAVCTDKRWDLEKVETYAAYFSSTYSPSSDRSSKPPVQALGNWNEARRKRGWMRKKESNTMGGEKGWSAKKGRTGEELRQRQTDRAAAHGTAQNGKN